MCSQGLLRLFCWLSLHKHTPKLIESINLLFGADFHCRKENQVIHVHACSSKKSRDNITAKFIKIFYLKSFPLYSAYNIIIIITLRLRACHADIVHKDLKSTLRVLYSIFGKYKTSLISNISATPTSQGNTSAM